MSRNEFSKATKRDALTRSQMRCEALGKLALKILPLSEGEKRGLIQPTAARVGEIDTEVCRLLLDGHRQKDIAAALGLNLTRLRRITKRIGIARRLPQKAFRLRDRTLTQLIWARIEPSQKDECWLWLGAKKTNGYGAFNYKGKCWQAHRAVYECLVAPIPDGLVIDHICENKGCVNPDHLQAVSQTLNVIFGSERRAKRP